MPLPLLLAAVIASAGAPILAVAAPSAPPPLRARGLGISIAPPPGVAWAVRLGEDGRPRAILAESEQDASWTVAIAEIRGDPSSEAIDQVIEYLQQLRGAGAEFSIAVNRPLRGASFDNHLLLLEIPIPAEEPEADAAPAPAARTGISGFLVVSRGEGRFLACSIAIARPAFPAVLPLIEGTLATLSLDSPEAISQWERSLLDAGRRRLASFTRERLVEVADGTTRWYRIHRPAQPGQPELEIGALAVTAAPAPRGLIDAAKDAAALRDAERDPGVLVTAQMRLVPSDIASRPPGTPPEVRDLEQRAWVALDRASEAWSLRQTDRVGRRTPSTAETGFLIEPTPAQPRAVLEVVTADRERLVRDPERFTLSEEPYLSQAESLLLGPLLREAARSGGEFTWTTYDRRARAVVRRLEQVLPDPSGGGFTLLSLAHPDDPAPLRQRFDSEGHLLERIDPDGTVTTRMDREALRLLWSRRGLPLQ